jgi:hypothetical protein
MPKSMKNGPNRIVRKKMDRMEGKMDRIAKKKESLTRKKRQKKCDGKASIAFKKKSLKILFFIGFI